MDFSIPPSGTPSTTLLYKERDSSRLFTLLMPNDFKSIVRSVAAGVASSYTEPWSAGEIAARILGPRKMPPIGKRKLGMTGGGHMLRKKPRVASAGYQLGRSLNRAPPTEKKAFDLAPVSQAFTAAGVFTVVNAPVNGPELFQRIGRKIYMKSLHVRGFVFNSATAITDYGRILVIYDSQPNGAVPALAALLQDSNAGAATTAQSELNLTNRERFKVIRDYPLVLNSATNAAGVLTNFTVQDPIKSTTNIDWFIKLKGLESIFNSANAGNTGDITSGAIFVVTASQTSSNQWGFNFSTRLRYYD